MIKYIFIEYILKPSLEVLFSELLNRVKKWYKTKRTSSKRLEVERGLEPLSFFIVEIFLFQWFAWRWSQTDLSLIVVYPASTSHSDRNKMLRKDQRSFVLLHCSAYYPCISRSTGSSAGHNRETVYILSAFDVPSPVGNQHNHAWLNNKADHSTLNMIIHAYGYTAIHHFPSRIRSVKHAMHPSYTY